MADHATWEAEVNRLRLAWVDEAMKAPTIAMFHRSSGGADALLVLMRNMGCKAPLSAPTAVKED